MNDELPRVDKTLRQSKILAFEKGRNMLIDKDITDCARKMITEYNEGYDRLECDMPFTNNDKISKLETVLRNSGITENYSKHFSISYIRFTIEK